jgi:hypothetical protein
MIVNTDGSRADPPRSHRLCSGCLSVGCRGVTSLENRDHRADARLASDHTGDVSVPGRVVCQHDVAGTETPADPACYLDLDLPGEGDDVLDASPARLPAETPG